jgi:N-acetylglucosaminyl-diphospho-decaprenol L-rhamnosyltransferase
MKWAERCFSSLRTSSVPIHCIVVDNGSTDGTQDYIQRNFAEVDFRQNEENLGFGKANNIGIETAYKKGADFFYLMNQDAWIYEDSIQKLIDVYNNYPQRNEIGILCPMQLDGTEKKLDIFLDKYIAQNFERRIISDFYINVTQPFYELSFINAAHWFIPKDTIEKVGGFNPYFFHYGEDNEYVNRLKFHGKKIILCPESKVVHDGKQLLGKVDYSKHLDLNIDTKILNPNFKDSFHQEKKALLQGIFKNIFLGNLKEAKKLRLIFSRIQRNSEELQSLKKIASTESHAFLNI